MTTIRPHRYTCNSTITGEHGSCSAPQNEPPPFYSSTPPEPEPAKHKQVHKIDIFQIP